MHPIDLEAFIEMLAKSSGEAILPFFRTDLGVQDKNKGGVFDPVTEADRAAETIIRRKIRDSFPAHGILGEEFPPEQSDAEFLWVIDPIDGTRAFLCGLPVWGTLIGLMRDHNPVLGVMHQPYTGEFFIGDGAKSRLKTRHGTRLLKTRSCFDLKDAVLMTTDPRLFSQDEGVCYRRVEETVKLTRFGADCYAYAMLSAGQVDLVIESGLKPYDIVGLIPLIEGAGGRITTWDGASAAAGGRILAAATPALHAAAMTLLSGHDIAEVI
jgi:histidinol phosphatase-like enzyme (inositol monophosphatase family)